MRLLKIAKYSTAVNLLLIMNNGIAWVCPNNFNQIVPGDTIAQVEAQCGKPISQTSTSKEANVPQEWTYYINASLPGQTGPTASGSVKMTIAFVNGKVVNITSQANSLSSTSICGPTISVGDSSESIKTACGKPVFIQKQGGDSAQEKGVEVIEYKYNTSPPNTLIFEDGRLKERK